MGVFHHLAGDGDVFLKAVLGAVDHHRGKTAVHTGFADVEVFAVIQMEGNGQTGFHDGGLHQFDEVIVLGIFPGAGRHLKDHRRIFLHGRLGDSLDDLHVVHIEGTDGITTFVGLFKHFFCTD